MSKITLEKDTKSYTEYIAGFVSINTDYDFTIVKNYDANIDYINLEIEWVDQIPYSQGTVELEELEKEILDVVRKNNKGE